MIFSCPRCRADLEISSRFGGAASACPFCRQQLTVPIPVRAARPDRTGLRRAGLVFGIAAFPLLCVPPFGFLATVAGFAALIFGGFALDARDNRSAMASMALGAAAVAMWAVMVLNNFRV